MKNLFRTLIPYKMTALLVLLLMAGQAYCEMNLPQYTQNIIDTGIQNHGIEHVIPEAVTASEMKAAEKYMSADQTGTWESLFTTDGQDGNVMTRTAIDKDAMEEYDREFALPLARRYAEQMGEALPADTAADDQNVRAMAIAYAASCDEEAGLDILDIQNRYMWKCGGLMFLMSVIVLLFTTGISFLAARVGADIGRNLRSRLFQCRDKQFPDILPYYKSYQRYTAGTDDFDNDAQDDVVRAVYMYMVDH